MWRYPDYGLVASEAIGPRRRVLLAACGLIRALLGDAVFVWTHGRADRSEEPSS